MAIEQTTTTTYTCDCGCGTTFDPAVTDYAVVDIQRFVPANGRVERVDVRQVLIAAEVHITSLGAKLLGAV
jgi:hypothetical protein